MSLGCAHWSLRTKLAFFEFMYYTKILSFNITEKILNWMIFHPTPTIAKMLYGIYLCSCNGFFFFPSVFLLWYDLNIVKFTFLFYSSVSFDKCISRNRLVSLPWKPPSWPLFFVSLLPNSAHMNHLPVFCCYSFAFAKMFYQCNNTIYKL